MKFLTSTEVADMIGVNRATLLRWETWDGLWCNVYGHRIRVYQTGIGPRSQRRYSEAEVMRLLYQIDGAHRRSGG